MRTTIVNGSVIVGDRKTILPEASLRIENEIINESHTFEVFDV